MAAGLPVVATAVDGTPEAVEHGETGFLVRPGDVTGLVDALTTLGRGPALRRRFGHRGRARSSAFTTRRAGLETLALYGS
jgi:glycosyltransferase involved in cell wall biosynthesis